MSVLRDSHRGIVPATVVYVYKSICLCNLWPFPWILVNSLKVIRVQVTLNPNRSS